MKQRCGNCDKLLVERPLRGVPVLYCSSCHYGWTKKKLARVHKHRRAAPADTLVSLVFEPNGKDHHDVVLRVGPWAHRSDSYYYGLDHVVGQRSDPVAAMCALLVQWKTAIATAIDDAHFYLPHDFSDQCTGWLRGTREANDIVLVGGWSQLEGYAFYPSEHLEAGKTLSDFEPIPDRPAVRLTEARLQADIDASVSALKRMKR